MIKASLRQFITVLTFFTAIVFAIAQEGVINDLNSLDGIKTGLGSKDANIAIVQDGEDYVLTLYGNTGSDIGHNHYFSLILDLQTPLNLENRALAFDARTETPHDTGALYFRVYGSDPKTKIWSFQNWNSILTTEWQTFTVQRNLATGGLAWEPSVVNTDNDTNACKIEFIIGSHDSDIPIDVRLRKLRFAPKILTVDNIEAYPTRLVNTELVKDNQAKCIILHPATEAGVSAANKVSDAILARTGIAVEQRPGTLDDCKPQQNAIFLGNLDSNPAMRLLYARYFTPIDSIFPGEDGYLVHTAINPFGGNINVIIAGASSDAGLDKAAEALAAQIQRQPEAESLVMPPVHEISLTGSMKTRYGKFLGPLPEDTVEKGLETGREILQSGKHTSIAGQLAELGLQYIISNDSKIAELYVKLWKMYGEYAATNKDTVLGKWGFDSDFPSPSVVSSWDIIEEDPTLSDADRMQVLKIMHQWMNEAVLPKCAGGNPERVTYNHGTFPSLGAFRYGEWLNINFDMKHTARVFIDKADKIFQAQALHTKPCEDCNSYQWLTLGHTLMYAMAKPDYSIFESGVATKIANYCIDNMDNFSHQVPYGDTGFWKCSNAEIICLDIIALATNNSNARWAANLKRRLRPVISIVSAYTQLPHPEDATPDMYNGIRWNRPDKAFYETYKTKTWNPQYELTVDKITFREKMDPNALFLLLDGITTGSHNHEDGNSISRFSQYGRIWLADNDYFKAPLKYHNSISVIANGESAPLPPFTQLVDMKEDTTIGFSETMFCQYANTDWRRYLIWLKKQKAILVVDRLTALEDGDYHFNMLWHGIGDATLDEDGLLLRQKGPSMRIQIADGPDLTLTDDFELGKNWNNYPFADPVVRSMSSIADVHLDKSQTYVFATLLHGNPDGDTQPMKLEIGKDASSVIFSDGQERTVASFFGPEQLISLTFSSENDLNAAQQPPQHTKHPGLVSNDLTPHNILWDYAAELQDDSITAVANANLSGTKAILVGTEKGKLIAIDKKGNILSNAQFDGSINSITAADLNKDGDDEIALALGSYKVKVINSSLAELWSYTIEKYRVNPMANLVFTGDINGDGELEVVCGAENWRFYAFDANGKYLWHYEVVHPARGGEVTDIDGDGKDDILCGTHYYSMSVLNGDGTKKWSASFGPICRAIAAGNFTTTKTKGVIAGSDNGHVYLFDYQGKLLRNFQAGEEVRCVLSTRLDDDELDTAIAGSRAGFVYAWNSDATLKWFRKLGSPVQALISSKDETDNTILIAGLQNGIIVSLDSKGQPAKATFTGDNIKLLLDSDDSFIAITSNNHVINLLP